MNTFDYFIRGDYKTLFKINDHVDQPTYEKLFLTKNTCIVSTKVVKKEDELI